MSRLSVNGLSHLTSHLLNDQRMRIARTCHRVNEEFIATITGTLSRRWSLTPSIETSWDLGSLHSMVTRNSIFSDQHFNVCETRTKNCWIRKFLYDLSPWWWKLTLKLKFLPNIMKIFLKQLNICTCKTEIMI